MDFRDVGLDKDVTDLSGGQRTKVLLAKLLLETPDILLLDEPTNYLDEEHIAWLKNYLIGYENAFILISHDIPFLNSVVNVIYHVENRALTRYTGDYDNFMRVYEQKKLDKMDRIELAAEKPKPEFNFKQGRTSGKLIFEARDLVIGYDEPLSKPLNIRMERGQKIALVGANGLGKSTLLKSLMGLIKPISGEVETGDYQSIGYFEQEIKEANYNSCIEEVWQEFPGYTQYEVRSALAKCGLTTKHIESSVAVLSGGEQAKVRLCKLINKETNILILDEPTNHLDVEAKDELKRALKEYKGSILLVCHEPEFYRDVVTDVWNCEEWTTKIV